MKRCQQPTFERARISDVLSFAQGFKRQGYMFVNINATTCADHCDVLYVFRASEGAGELVGRTVSVKPGDQVPSITGFYPAAFVFENETHDLFGVDFTGINIDYEGNFYKLSVAYPMNPKASAKGSAQDAGDSAGVDIDRGEA